MAKKICIFCSHYFPYLGGVERYTYQLAKALTEQGDKVVIVTSNDMHLERFAWMEGIPVFRMPCFNLLEGRFPISKPNREFRKLHRRLRQISFDFVLVQTRFYPHSLYGLVLAHLVGAKAAVVDHGTSHMTIGKPPMDLIGACYEHGITAIQRLLCQDFYGVSKACCRWLEHFHIQAKGTLYNAVDIKKIDELLAQPVRDYRAELGIAEEDLVVTYTGRLVKEKGIRELVEAVRMPFGRRLHLLVAGDGEELESLRAQQREGLHLLGRLDFTEVIALLRQTDIYCLPTDYPEGFPTAVLEAAACGCYVITTWRGGSGELILDDSYGMIMRDNRPATIRRALQAVCTDDEKRRRAAAKACRRVREHFTWERTAQHVHSLYQ